MRIFGEVVPVLFAALFIIAIIGLFFSALSEKKGG